VLIDRLGTDTGGSLGGLIAASFDTIISGAVEQRRADIAPDTIEKRGLKRVEIRLNGVVRSLAIGAFGDDDEGKRFIHPVAVDLLFVVGNGNR
jgi:hypothetical protein